jgi:hypothetical protein
MKTTNVPSTGDEKTDRYIAALIDVTHNVLRANPGITSDQLGTMLGMSRRETISALRCVAGIAGSVTAQTQKEGRRTVTRWWYLPQQVVN